MTQIIETHRSYTLKDDLSQADQKAYRTLLSQFKIELLSARYHETLQSWRQELRTLDDTFLFIPVQGKVLSVVEGQPKVLGVGDCLLVPEGLGHEQSLVDAHTPFNVFALHLHMTDVWGNHFAHRLDSPFAHCGHFDFWDGQFRQLISFANNDLEGSQVFSSTVLAQFFCVLFSNGLSFKKAQEQRDHRIVAALQTINAQFKEDTSIETLSKQAQLSSVQFRKLFKRLVGHSPKAYIAKQRLQAASRLLRSTALSVKEIAYEAGFQEDRYFYYCFKRHYRVTPHDYRKRYQAEI